MVKFLRKFENRGIKIARVNLILITKSINLQLFTLIFYGGWVRCGRRRFLVLSLFMVYVILEIKFYTLRAIMCGHSN